MPLAAAREYKTCEYILVEWKRIACAKENTEMVAKTGGLYEYMRYLLLSE